MLPETIDRKLLKQPFENDESIFAESLSCTGLKSAGLTKSLSCTSFKSAVLRLFHLHTKCGPLIINNNMRLVQLLSVFAAVLASNFVTSWRWNAGTLMCSVRTATGALSTSSLRRMVASATLATCLGGNSAALAQDADPAAVNALEQIMRVQRSLKYIDDTINSEGNPTAVVSQINLLLKNYKMKDNVVRALPLITDGTRREEARTHGVAAIDDLQVVTEYFDDDINDTTGQKTPPRAVLQLAVQATAAANKEMSEFYRFYPSDIVATSTAKVALEFSE